MNRLHRKSLALASGILLAGTVSIVAAQAPPEFRKGMWEFTRTVDDGAGKPQTLNRQKCTSPSEDMRAQRASGAKMGCKASPVAKSASTYTYTVTCEIKGTTVESTSVMSVESDSAYRIDIQSKGGGKSTKEQLVAKRTGDC